MADRNRIAASLLLAAVVAGLASGVCAQAPQRPVLRVAVESLGNEALDPILGPASAAKLYMRLLYDSLIGTDAANSDISKETGVARDWRISDDGKTYTFFIRQGVKFHNGDELTAEDVKFSFERAIGPRSVASYAGALKKVIDTITVVDPYTVRFQLREPKFSFLLDASALIGAESMIVPKKYIQQVGEEKFATQPVGSGPYRLKKQTPGFAIEFEALATHWSAGIPRFSEVHLLNVPEQGTRLAMLRSGEADVISVARQQAAALQKAGFIINGKRAANQMMLLINNQWERDSPLHDARVREAMSVAIDRKTLLDRLLSGAGEVTNCWVMDLSYARRVGTLCDPAPYDPAKAKRLLADAGYPNGIDLTFRSYPTFGVPEKLEVDQAIAGYLRAVGIRANISQGEYGAYRSQWAKPESVPRTIANNPTISHVVIGSTVQVYYAADGLLSMTRGVNPKVDTAMDAMLKARTLDEYSQRLLAVWQEILAANHVAMLFSIDSKYAANPKKVSAAWPMGTSTADIGLRLLVAQ